MNKLWRFISSAFFVLTAVVCVFELYRSFVFIVNQIVSGFYTSYLFLSTGIALCIILQKTLLRKNIGLLQTMSHEGAHMLVGCILLRQKFTSFRASAEKGGEVNYLGHRNIFMSLAPYYLPYLTFGLLLIRLMIKPEYLPIIDTLTGVSLMFHISCWSAQTRNYQTDLRNHGLFRSYLFIVTLIAFNFAIVFYSLGVADNMPVDLWRANAIYFEQAYSDVVWAVGLL